MDKSFNDIIIVDTETTGLLAPNPAKIEVQPYITELYAVRLSPEFDFVDELDIMFKPPIPISEEITKITGITQADVDQHEPFISGYDKLYELFHGCKVVVGHNIEFDLSMIRHELFRYDLEYKFGWPKKHICTVESSFHYKNKRLRLQQLYQHLFGRDFVGAHRAKSDVEATGKCFIEMVSRGDITLGNFK